MKKVIISLVAVLGLASAAWAFTPSTKTETPTAAPAIEEHVHTHVEEMNSHEGHQHDVAGQYCQWQCSRCGKTYGWSSNRPYGKATGNCSSTSSGEHIWSAVQCK